MSTPRHGNALSRRTASISRAIPMTGSGRPIRSTDSTEIAQEGYFTAEHVYPWMWDDYSGLRGHKAAANLLADHTWPRVYDPDRLRHNEVPVAATIYANDLYVERTFAEETAATIRGLRPWVTDEFEHNGLRADPDRVLGRLIDL